MNTTVIASTGVLVDDLTRKAIISKEKELRVIFNSLTELSDPKKLDQAQKLLSQIGNVDVEIEGLQGAENQRDLSVKFHWGHNHRFSDSLQVTGRMGDRHLNLMAQFMVRHRLEDTHFDGKDVVDVGCWTGGTLLLLKALGAKKVLALEEVQKYAAAAQALCKNIYEQDDVICEGTNIYDLETSYKYDVVYFPGVVYHLSDPVLALRRLYNAIKDGGEIFVETMGLNSDESICEYHGNRKFHSLSRESEQEMNRGGWNWFVPSPSCLERWMLEAGFEDIDCYYSQYSNRVFGYGRRNRFVDITRAGLSVRDIS